MSSHEAERMRDDTYESAPVWARRTSRGGGGGNPLVALLFALLAMTGALCLGLAIWQKSFAEGGAYIDRWIAPVTSQIADWLGQAGGEVEETVESATATETADS